MGEQEQVVKCLRGICVSSKGLLSLRQLRSDYYAIIGENIPFAKYGHKRLEDFIKGTDSLDLVFRNGEPFVQAKVTEQSAHISEMVRKQKTSSKKKPPSKVRFNLGQKPPRFSHTASSSSRWRPKYSGDSWKQYRGSQRPQAVAHAQFVQRTPSKVVPTQKYQQVDPSMSQRAAQNHVNAQKSSTNHFNAAYGKPAVNQAMPMRDAMNDRLNQHRDGDLPGGNRVTNGVAHPANVLFTAQNQYYSNNVSQKSLAAPSQPNITNDTPPITPTTPSAPAVFANINPLVAAKKRINRMMSELSLERDSGNCSPVSDISPPSPCKTPEEFPRTGDPMADLKAFAELHKLGEVEVSVKSVRHKKRGLGMVTCKIKVGKNTYTSYPNEFTTEEQAKRFCCEEALADLIPKYQRRKSLLISSEKDILERIPQMLEKHHNGIWSWQLCLDYADRYKEQLPPDWMKIVDLSPSIQIEKLSDDYVLCHCEPGDKSPNQQQRRSLGVPITNVSVPANTVQFGEDSQLFAQITLAMSAGEIWLQQVQTKESDDFLEMVGRMELYYGSRESQLIPVSVVKTGYYVAKLEGQYFRVRAVDVSETEVACFFIDYGDEMTVPKDSIFELKREYASVQAQAFVVRLAGLEDLYEISNLLNNSKALQEITNKNVTVELATDDIASPAEGDLSIRVYLYDIKEGKSLNEELIKDLTMESASPKLYLQQEKVVEVYVSNIENNGDVYVQLRTYGFDRFQTLKQSLVEEITAKPPKYLLKKVTKSNSDGKLYFSRNATDEQWHRIKLIDWSPDGVYAQIYYVDVGNTAVITVDKEILYPLEHLSDIVNQYPPQATKVRMTGVDLIPADFVQTMTKMMPLEEQVILKVVEYQQENEIYLVEFFTRNTDGGLFSINRSISMKSELQKEDKSKTSTLSSSSKHVPSSGTLPPPKIPDSNDFFPIAIPFAVNPFNFFVQPLETEQELNKMMERLQEKYRHVQYGGLKVDDIVPGNIYASKHDDDVWYRTSVIKVIHSGSVSVFFCDFGYYQNLTVQQLVPLDDEFLQLPYQALKAKIADLKPKHEKWSMDDCDQFKEMVEKKWFYSKVKEIEKDVFYESDVVLKLQLIDTSTDEDIFIDKELIKKGIAIRA